MSQDVVDQVLELLRNEKHQAELEHAQAKRELKELQKILQENTKEVHWWAFVFRFNSIVIQGDVAIVKRRVDFWQKRVEYYSTVIAALERGEYMPAIQLLEREISNLMRREDTRFGTRTQAQELDDLLRKLMLLVAEQ